MATKTKQQTVALVIITVTASPGELLTKKQWAPSLIPAPRAHQSPAQSRSPGRGAQALHSPFPKTSHSWEFSIAGRLQRRPWDFPGKSTGVGCHFLLQRIFPTQGSNPGLLHCRQLLYPLSHQGKVTILALCFGRCLAQGRCSVKHGSCCVCGCCRCCHNPDLSPKGCAF